MTPQIVITTGARLHFGLLSHGIETRRRFGGVGLMIDRPGFELRLSVSDRDEIIAPTEYTSRLELLLARYREQTAADRQTPAVLELAEAIPPHVGLGAGTQLGMALAMGLARLAGEHPSPEHLALRVGRGARSALGVHGFSTGGFLVEGGKLAESEISPLVAHARFPEAWRIVLIRPPIGTGLSGAAEVAGFSRLAPMPASTTDRLCRLAVMDLLPAVIEADFEHFSESIYRFGRTVGEYFAPVQSGTYADEQMRQLVPQLRGQGVRGVGQSSWGPTLFVLQESEAEAKQLVHNLAIQSQWSHCETMITRALNRPATVETLCT